AYGNQPKIAHWNLARFAEALLPLLNDNREKALQLARDAVDTFPEMFQRAWIARMRAKLGLFTEESGDEDLAEGLLEVLHHHRADFTNSFRDLAFELTEDVPMFRSPEFIRWHEHWKARINRQVEPISASLELMRANNPALIPRNHRVEAALEAAVQYNDLSVMERLVEVLSDPYEDSPEKAEYRTPPSPSAQAYRTFCGT
ncbi:MAG: protein adenylyltransferase SelO family protein, partial [Syntrophales bacterium]|nr:protein adenylyltransferase SelO family protein [Syntrophales bacterium]